MKPVDANDEIWLELSVAREKFGAFKSNHEGLAVIWEEFEELKKEVFKKSEKRSKARLRKEARHVAAMGMRFMIDLT